MAKKVGNTYYFTGKGKSSGGGGGGGDATDAIKYTEQTLTSPQQMQARANQGLYYDFPEEIKTANGWDAGETYGENHKFITSDTPLPDDIKGLYDNTGSSMVSSIDDSQLPNYYLVNHNQYWPAFFLIILQESTEGTYANWPKGIYIRTSGLPTDYDKYYLEYTAKARDFSQIPPKYIKDMYYEESVVKTMYYDIYGDMYGEYRKVSNEVIESNAVIGHKFTSSNGTEYTITEDMVIVADSTHPTRILYDASDPNDWAILIFPEDMEFESDSFSKGVWFKDTGTVFNPNHIESLEYDGVTVHQIPAKYVPNVGAPAVKIEIPSMGDDVYYNMGMLNVNQYVPSRDVKFSVEGRTVQYVFVADVINGGGNSQEGDTYTFTSGGLYWVQLELNYEYGLLPYVCAMVYVESDNQ